eukprot:NODE_133_length_2259_cov_186.208145_g108_i0.p1 GENE.NODE_133_length_2259_cov_186.208145_g108_i0~~NODE_133_length_2259_cov_186.208145_g108_i0.p1  ORF type:complete len:592 (+),score=116.11 NODE_133_length_2259_cov_186.208145_g108_i0:61-1836(+)
MSARDSGSSRPSGSFGNLALRMFGSSSSSVGFNRELSDPSSSLPTTPVSSPPAKSFDEPRKVLKRGVPQRRSFLKFRGKANPPSPGRSSHQPSNRQSFSSDGGCFRDSFSTEFPIEPSNSQTQPDQVDKSFRIRRPKFLKPEFWAKSNVTTNTFISENTHYCENFLEHCLLGRGFFGEVWKVSHILDEQFYAIKKDDSVRGMQSKLEEVRILARAGRHAHIVRYFGSWADRERNTLYIQTECCEGGSLRGAMRSGVWNESRLGGLIRQMGDALRHLHSIKIAHLDIKPDNIFIADVDGTSYRLGDFGVARDFGKVRTMDNGEGDSRYLCKFLLNSEEYLPQADIFSLGLTIYEIVLGHDLPKSGPDWQKIRSDPLTDLDDCSTVFRTLLQSMSHADPTLRPSAEELTHRAEGLGLDSPQFSVDFSQCLVSPAFERKLKTIMHPGSAHSHSSCCPTLPDTPDAASISSPTFSIPKSPTYHVFNSPVSRISPSFTFPAFYTGTVPTLSRSPSSPSPFKSSSSNNILPSVSYNYQTDISFSVDASADTPAVSVTPALKRTISRKPSLLPVTLFSESTSTPPPHCSTLPSCEVIA